MTATAEASTWDKALPTLARAARIPAGQKAAAYIGEWLAVLADSPDRLGECCAELDDYARDLRRAGVLVGDQAAGFLLALWARLNPRSPLTPTLVWFVDERKARAGWKWCKWRGWVPVHEFDAWRHDRAQERADAPSKFQRGRD
jgi:hypothetical protein